MTFYLKRNDRANLYVAESGENPSGKSYTPQKRYAKPFVSRDAAEAERRGNEYITEEP